MDGTIWVLDRIEDGDRAVPVRFYMDNGVSHTTATYRRLFALPRETFPGEREDFLTVILVQDAAPLRDDGGPGHPTPLRDGAPAPELVPFPHDRFCRGRPIGPGPCRTAPGGRGP